MPPDKDIREMLVQTRNEVGALKFFDSVADAIAHANHDPTVWKVSFTIPQTGERIILTRDTRRSFLSRLFSSEGAPWTFDSL